MFIDPRLLGTLNVLGKKWAAHLLVFLTFHNESNFTKLKRELKLTSKSLSKSLRLLEAGGFIEKLVFENPRKITYRLTESGKRLSEFLVRWWGKNPAG